MRQNSHKKIIVFVSVSYVATTMAGMIYPAMIGAPPPRAMMYRPFLIPEQVPAARENQQPANDKCPNRKRPASQATSVKAEPGSIMAMSESSKKVKQPLTVSRNQLMNMISKLTVDSFDFTSKSILIIRLGFVAW